MLNHTTLLKITITMGIISVLGMMILAIPQNQSAFTAIFGTTTIVAATIIAYLLTPLGVLLATRDTWSSTTSRNSLRVLACIILLPPLTIILRFTAFLIFRYRDITETFDLFIAAGAALTILIHILVSTYVYTKNTGTPETPEAQAQLKLINVTGPMINVLALGSFIVAQIVHDIQDFEPAGLVLETTFFIPLLAGVLYQNIFLPTFILKLLKDKTEYLSSIRKPDPDHPTQLQGRRVRQQT